jgi:hypothetical protein
VDNNLSSIQEEAIQLDRVFDQPDIVLSENKEKREVQRKELEKDPTIMYNYLQMVSIGEPQIRHRRIFTLLEHLERRISDKRQAVYLNRTLLIGTAAFIMALISIIVTVTL